MEEKTKIKIGIYGVALLMTGVIGASSSLSVIMAHFAKDGGESGETAVINALIAVPCLVIIPMTLIIGKIMEFVTKKTLAILGIILFLIGGVVPAFLDSLAMIAVFRGVLGIGLGMIQVVPAALVAENFEGQERNKAQGGAMAAQMFGCIVMSLVGGWLGSIAWNYVFYVHLIAVIPLFIAIAFVPATKTVRAAAGDPGAKATLTSAAWMWAVSMFVFFIACQTFSNFLSFIATELQLGESAVIAGRGLALFAFGGFLMGLIFGKLASVLKNFTLMTSMLGIAAAYFLCAHATSDIFLYVSSVIFGMAFGMALPCLFVSTANSVEPGAAGMAVSLATCAQNLGMFASAMVVGPAAVALANVEKTNINQMAYIFSGGMLVFGAVLAIVWAVAENRKAAA